MEEHYPYFFTATILEWKKLLKPDKYKDIIIESLRFLVKNNRIKLYAFVIMPNHIHLIWRVITPWTRAEVQRDFLKYVSIQIKADLQRNHENVLNYFRVYATDRKYQFWEREPLSVVLYDLQMLEQKLSYIHRNPIQEKWNLVEQPIDYFYSSAYFYEVGVDKFGFLTSYTEDGF